MRQFRRGSIPHCQADVSHNRTSGQRYGEDQDGSADGDPAAGIGERQLVADGDRDDPDDHRDQGVVADGDYARGVGQDAGRIDADVLGAVEVAPPERNRAGEGDREDEEAVGLQRLAGKGVADRQHGLAEGDEEEEAEALEQVLGVDLAVGAEGAAAAGQGMARDDAAVGDQGRRRPERQASVAVDRDPRDPRDRRGGDLPGHCVDEVPVEPVTAEGEDREERAADLDREVAEHEEAGATSRGRTSEEVGGRASADAFVAGRAGAG